MSSQRSDQERPARRPADVCAELDIQPYVLKFWEGEFPQLGRRIGPKRNYGPDDVEIAREIRRLLEEEGLSLGDAREAVARTFPESETGAPSPALPFDGRPPAPSGRSSDLERELQDARDRAADAEQTLAALQAHVVEVADAEQRITDLDAALARTREEQAETIAGLRRDVETERTRVIHLQEELHRAWDETVPLRDSNARLGADIEELRERTDAERRDLATRISGLEAAVGELRDPAARSVTLAAELAGLEETVDRLRAEISARNEEASRLSSELEILKEAHRAAAGTAALLPAATESLAALEQELAGEREQAAAERATAAGRIEEQGIEMTRLAAIAERVPGLERVLENAVARAEEAEAVAARLPAVREEAAALRAALEERQQCADALTTRVAELEREYADLEERSRSGLENLSAFEDLLAAAERTGDELRCVARQEIEAALQQVRHIASGAEKLVRALAAAAVVPRRESGGGAGAGTSANG